MLHSAAYTHLAIVVDGFFSLFVMKNNLDVQTIYHLIWLIQQHHRYVMHAIL